MSGPLPLQPMRDVPAFDAEARALLDEFGPLSGGRASVASQDRLAASRDLWPRSTLWARAGFAGPLPAIVLWPSNVEEVRAVVRRARELSVPMVVQGGGSGTAGASLPTHGGIALDLKRLSRVIAIDPRAQEIECEAGIVGERLERTLRRSGLSLGHEAIDARSATLGGWLSTRSAGWAVGRHGRLEDRVASLTCVDGRGELFTTPRRPAPGWDVAQALLGSEGCLAVLCAARLRVVEAPAKVEYQAWRFKTLAEGIEALRALFRSGLRPVAVQLSDPLDPSGDEEEGGSPVGRRGRLRRRFDAQVAVPLRRLIARAAAGHPAGLNAAARALRSCTLSLAFEGPADLCAVESEEATRLCHLAHAEELGAEPARLCLASRLSAPFAAARAWDDGTFVDAIDVGAPWDRALETQRRVQEAIGGLALVRTRITRAYPEGCCLEFAIAGEGVDLEAAISRHDEICRRALAAAVAVGASLSHHGGVGLQRLAVLKGLQGDGVRLVRALKATFDPAGILNPGKLGG